MFKNIVVALDCGESSHRVLHALNSLSLTANSCIILTHILSKEGDESAVDRPHPSREIIEDQLRCYQSQIATPSEIEVIFGDPAEEIIRLANIYQADLIVIGSRGLTGVQRVIEDSVSSLVVAEATCSVLVVKA
ncbi:MAG: universal stress protein [Microcystis aeruginosa K13-05]|jgi:nucleotide-binding universal stress UspA family protein|uniref:Genome sequencing data, contig C290 n=1 Tax=Microcystis aeruginosa PCC 9443 TaxID=1160281 RepID=I4GBC7_MICAE|nr:MULTISPECIES: universal stress protein [Microcystis]MBE5230262.1 universal stress protein [Microcystis aeruginosa PMC 728.11]MCE2662014.1 universal stress protein [Microcystis sp. 53602_E8]MCZ8362983.1 universal stress protein [Microcystis sp. LE19-251.1A]MDJ0527750.1 universal stress protein [Microcystis sp. M53600_WE12]MDJ0545242.1 universal stress protein [Microcystis sp. M53601_WE4]NCR79430.1 universal stress protein [Microcystis aeruginosa K13-10]NCR84172.1 universal stress protein [